MKDLIKITLILIAAFLTNATTSKAQSGPPVCKIHYAYDLSGNRVKREYKCENTWLPSDPAPWTDASIFTTVFPNPTSGVITGVFSSSIGGEAGAAMITVSTMGGVVVFQQEYNYVTSSITLDLSQQIPGDYLLTAAAFGMVESFVITKM